MEYNGYLISKRGKDSAVLIIQINKNKSIGFFIPKFKNILKDKTKAISSELKDNYIKNVMSELPKSTKQIKVITKTSIDKEYKNNVIRTTIKIGNSELGLTFVHSKNIPSMKQSESQWLIMKRKNPLLEDSNNKKPTCLFIKGNPKYWIKGKSEKFYRNILSICKDTGYRILMAPSNIPISKLPVADVVVGFSRGDRYLKVNSPKWKYKIAIGSGKMPKNVIILNNPNDRTMYGDLSKKSLSAHWTLTDEQATKLKNNLLKIKEDLSETSVMGAITPYSKNKFISRKFV